MADEVITIENFETKLSKYDPGSSKQLFGLVDMGSNGIRFSITDLSEPRSRLLRCIFRERAGISLYDALHDTAPGSKPSHFSPALIQEVANTLARFKATCKEYQVPVNQISAFATEATRTAENKDELLNAILKSSGLRVNILSPAMESMFGAMGARSGFTNVNGLFMDLGGGSVQMTYINSQVDNYALLAAKAAKSMPYGAAKLTLAMTGEGASSTELDLRTQMRDTFEGLKVQFPELKAEADSKRGVAIYFCGGGFRGYGSMLMHTHDIQPYPIPAIGGFTVPGSSFVRFKHMLKANEQDGKIYNMSKRRRAQFPAIALVVESLVEAIPRINQVTFCSGGNREGVLYMKLPPSVRESKPLPLLPGGFASASKGSVDAILASLKTALPDKYPPVFTSDLQEYIVRNTWVDMGNPDDANSAKALHNPISGAITGYPGLTHQIRAVLALTLCARWGSDIAPIDRKLYDNLRKLVGEETAFWCDYFGIVAGFLATVFPAYPANTSTLSKGIHFKARNSETLGKKGKKSGVLLEIKVASQAAIGIDINETLEMFEDVGKGLDIDLVVETKLQS